jgi:hypothetical protein
MSDAAAAVFWCDSPSCFSCIWSLETIRAMFAAGIVRPVMFRTHCAMTPASMCSNIRIVLRPLRVSSCFVFRRGCPVGKRPAALRGAAREEFHKVQSQAARLVKNGKRKYAADALVQEVVHILAEFALRMTKRIEVNLVTAAFVWPALHSFGCWNVAQTDGMVLEPESVLALTRAAYDWVYETARECGVLNAGVAQVFAPVLWFLCPPNSSETAVALLPNSSLGERLSTRRALAQYLQNLLARTAQAQAPASASPIAGSVCSPAAVCVSEPKGIDKVKAHFLSEFQEPLRYCMGSAHYAMECKALLARAQPNHLSKLVCECS